MEPDAAAAAAAETRVSPLTLKTDRSQTCAVLTAVETSDPSRGSGPAHVAPTGPPRALPLNPALSSSMLLTHSRTCSCTRDAT